MNFPFHCRHRRSVLPTPSFISPVNNHHPPGLRLRFGLHPPPLCPTSASTGRRNRTSHVLRRGAHFPLSPRPAQKATAWLWRAGEKWGGLPPPKREKSRGREVKGNSGLRRRRLCTAPGFVTARCASDEEADHSRTGTVTHGGAVMQAIVLFTHRPNDCSIMFELVLRLEQACRLLTAACIPSLLLCSRYTYPSLSAA